MSAGTVLVCQRCSTRRRRVCATPEQADARLIASGGWVVAVFFCFGCAFGYEIVTNATRWRRLRAAGVPVTAAARTLMDGTGVFPTPPAPARPGPVVRTLRFLGYLAADGDFDRTRGW